MPLFLFQNICIGFFVNDVALVGIRQKNNNNNNNRKNGGVCNTDVVLFTT